MCPGITEQCRRSFCKPLCLRMAWQPRIVVRCEEAPTWKWCPKFKAQVEHAHRAVAAQFQAFTCANLHFCGENDHLTDWVENHSFGDQYPRHHLPVPACKHESATPEQTEMLCDACERVVDVEILRGECMPQFKLLQPGSLQERCLYLADVIGNRKDDLVREFRKLICPCLGCCPGKCLFRNVEENWLKDLVASVQQKVTAQLELGSTATKHKDKDKAKHAKPAGGRKPDL